MSDNLWSYVAPKEESAVNKNRSLYDNLGDFLSANSANFSDVRMTERLGDLREELSHSDQMSDEEFDRKVNEYNQLFAEREFARQDYRNAHNNLVKDDSFLKNIDQMGGTFEGMAAQGIGTAVGAGLGFLTPVVGGTAVGAKVGNAAGAIAGAYLDARSVALQAQEDVLDAGGTWEQAKQAYDETLKKASLTTLPETAVDIAMGNRMVSGVLGSKTARRLAGSTIGRAGSAVLDPAARLGTKAAFASGNRLVGRGVGLATDIALQGATEAGQEVTQDYIANREAAKALGQQDNEYSLGGFKDYALSDQGLETMKTAGIMGALFGGVGGAVSSGQYLSRGAETNVGIKTHNAFSGMQNEKGIKLDQQARAEQEMILSKLRGFSREELASWSDADIVAESAVAMGDMRKNITGEESDMSQIREAVDTVARLSKDQNSITKEGQITEETRDLLTRMGFDEKDINDWFASPTDVLAKARQVEQEEQAKQKQAEGEKSKTTMKVSKPMGETLNVKDGEVVQGQKPTEQTTDTQEPITEKTTQNSLGEQAKQAEQQGTIQQDEEIEYPDSIIGWERDYDADNRDGVEYDSATYYSLKDNSVSARIEPSGNGFTVIKVDEQGNATSDSKNKNFPSLKAAIDYLQQNKGETVFQGSDEQAQAELPSDGVNADAGNSGTLVGSVEDLYNLSQQEPDLLNPYEFAEFVRIKQHMGAGDLDVYFDRRKGYTLGEDGQWHEVNASATPAATAKGRAIIQLYKGGDLGSAIHEIAHTAYWKLSDADKRTFGYYAIKTQGKYIADSLDEDYTPEFENRLLKLASKVSQNVELDEQDKQLQEKILSKAATNQIYDNLITFYNSKMNGGAVDLKNLTPQQQRAIEERWAWEMSQWYVEGYSVGVAPNNIIQRIAQRGCESIAKDLNSLARIWQHIHHKDNNEIENIYRGGQAEQQQEQAEQTPNINVQFTNEFERQAMPNVNMPMNFGGEQAIQYGVPTLGESYNDAQEYANLYNELGRRYANRQKMQGLPSTDGSIPTVQNRPTQTEKKKTTTGYKEAIPTTKANKEEEKLVDIIKNRKSGWEKALERLAEINPKTFRNILYSEDATQGEQVNGQGLTNQNENGIVEQKKEVADNGETENTRGTEDLQGNVGEVQGRGAVRTGDDSRTGTGRIKQETVEGSSEGNGKDIPLLKNTKFKSVYNKREEKKTEIKDWRDLSDSDQAKQVYVDALNASKEANEDYGVYVSEQTVESLKDCKVVLHKNKMAGFAITPDGNIVGVFSNPKNPIRGVLNDMIFIARMMGGNSMDCFGDFLLYGYRACGFTPVARTTFDETYYPASDPKNATIRKEHPDVFFLVKDNDNESTYLDKINKGEYKNDEIKIESIYHIEGEDSYGDALNFQGQVLNETQKKGNTNKSTRDIAESLRPREENINNLSNTKFSNPEMEAKPLPQTNFTTPTLKAQPMNESVTRTNGINTGRPMYFNPINKQTLNEMNTTQQPKQEQAKEKPKPKKTTEQKPTKQEVKQETKQEQPKGQAKPTIPTDEIYSHLYFGDKTGKLKYNPKTKKIEYFVEEAGGRDPITLRKTYKLVNKGEITPEQYNELRQKYEQDFRKAKGEKKENAPDLVEGMKKEDFMYSAYKETKRTEKEKEDTIKELGKENQGLITGKSEEYARQNSAEESFNNAMKGESLSEMEETELTKEQKNEVESSVEQELPKVEKKKTEETKKTTSKPKTTDFLSALHKKYKNITGTPIGEKGYRFKEDEKAFIEGFKGMIDGAIGNKEELVNVAKRLDSWFQNDPTERNRMVRKYLSQYLADAAKINNKQNTEVRHQLSDKAQNVRFQAVSVKDTKALESKYEQDFLKVGKQMGYTENEINYAFILYATGNTNINIDTSKENNKAERIFVRINNKINNDIWKSGQNVQRGLDGKWRTYIDDRKATLKSGILKLLNEPNKIKGKTFYLGQIMSHLDLYKYNKKLKGVKVQFKDFGSKSNKLGQVTENGTIELNYRKMNTEKDLMSTLLHEIQHIIQKNEGFARGGNGKAFLDPRNQTLFSALTKNILNDVEKIVKFAQDNEYPLTQKQADKILNMDEFEFEKYLNENSTIGVILNDYIELKNKKFDLYKNLLGEIEARDASLRYGLDNEHYNKIKPLDLDYQYRKLKENRNNVTVRFQKSDIIKDETSNTSGFQIKSDGNIFGLNTKLSNEQVGQIQDDLMSFIEDSPSITKDTLRNLKNIYKNEISQYKRLYTISDNEDDREIATLNINNDKKKLQVVDKLLETMKDGDIIAMNNRPSNVIDITNRIKNRDSRFQKSEEGEERKLTKKQEKKLEIQKEIKEAKEKGQTTDTYKDVYSVSFTKSAQESKVNQEKMKYFDERKSAWERHESDGRVTYTRTTPFEHHQKVITYNGINDKIVEQKPKKKYEELLDFIKEKISKNLFNDQYALYKLATDLGLGDAYMRMVVTQGYAQKTGVALEKGIMYNGKRTRAMNDIAREIGEEKQSAFCEYAIAKHLQDIYNRPNNKIEQKYDKDEVDAVIKRVEASKDYELFERCRKDLVEYNHACFHVLVDGGIITEQEFQKYVERDKNYVPLSKVMDKEDFGFNSIQFARSMVNVGSPIRKLGTSKREIKNIFGEMQRRTAIYYKAAARNKAGQIFVNEICGTLDKMYDGDTVSRGASIIRKVKVKEEDGKLITRQDTDKQIFYVNNGGKHEFYQVSDPEIYRALRHLDEEQLHIINGMLEKMLSAPAGLVRATATATPDFGIRNIIRDNLTAFYTSEHGFIPIIDALWGMREIKRNGEFYQRYIDQVGEYGLKGRGELLKNNTYKLKDYRESLKDEILKEFNILTDGKRSLKDRTKALLRMTIGAPFFAFGEQLERFNMYLEQGTRVGEFKNAKMGYNGLIDRITSDLSTDINKARQSDIIAAYKAQDVTLYFSQHGLLGGKFNRFVPFLNASLLGAQKFVNAIDLMATGKDSMNQKNTRLRKELLFKVALSTAFAIGLSAAGHGDEDYDEAPDYEKDTFWIFPNGIRIPKDEVFGRSIGTAVQRAFDQYYKEGKVDVLKTFESIAGMFKPNTVLPTVLDMFYGSIYNKDSFTGREIIPEYMTHKVGYQQKDIYTGNLAADLTEVLYKAFGINLSAKRVDWALQKNLTNAKKYLDAVYDVKKKLTDPEHFNEKMARGYDKNDSTGSFVGGLRDGVPPVLNLVTGTFATNRSQYQSVSDFQKKYKEIKQIADNDSDIPMTREQKRKWQRYEKAYKEYTKLRKQLKAIRSNASLSGADKREKAEPIFKKQIKLAEWAEG